MQLAVHFAAELAEGSMRPAVLRAVLGFELYLFFISKRERSSNCGMYGPRDVVLL